MSTEMPNFEKPESVERESAETRATDFAEREIDLVEDGEPRKRVPQNRFVRMFVLGTVLAGGLAAPQAEGGEYRRSREYRERAGYSGEGGRRIISSILNGIEAHQSRKAQEAQQIYADLQQKLQKLERQIQYLLERAERRAQRLRERGDSQEAHAILEESKQQAEPALREREILQLAVDEAGHQLQKQLIKLEILRQGRYTARR